MASHLHELIVRLFRGEPERLKALVPGVFDRTSELVVKDRDPTLSPSTLASLRSADLLVTATAEDRTQANVILEVQLGIDPAKRWSWPAYVANFGAKTRLNTWLVVVAIDENVAAWARAEIRWMNGCSFAPIVIGPSEIPAILDAVEARHDPVGAILSVLAHPTSSPADLLVHATEAAFDALDPEVRPYYTDVVLDALAKRAPELLEHFMPITAPANYEIQFEPLKQLIARGRVEGRIEGEIRVVVRQLERKFGPLEASVRARVESASLEELDRFADRLLDAATLDDVFDSER